MGVSMITVIIVIVLVALAVFFLRSVHATTKQRQFDDARAEAGRWVERLGGQVLNLTGTTIAAKQALADASERYHAAGSQLEQATSVEQAGLAKETALEGLYYVRAARVAMGMDAGPALPQDEARTRAGAVTEHRRVEVDGETYEASPRPGQNTPHYYPGGEVAGRPVPQGWYSQPWWKPALIGGAWGLGSAVLFGALFTGMSGIADAQTWQSGYEAGQQDAGDSWAGLDDLDTW
ncbi:hypothetical protein [Kibdelosporangium aridum]|uniref:hypothetical protein n=1 Tax=Kibdelosporangium aridum TaxID=2030 RepID=UPI0037BE5734